MIYISIINHNHDELLVRNKELVTIALTYTVIIKSNTKASAALTEFAKRCNILLLDEHHQLGFGENNNYVFEYVKRTATINEEDYFLVMNPDITITLAALSQLESHARRLGSDIYTINLFHDDAFSIPELSIKSFPLLSGPFKGLISRKKRSDAYNKAAIDAPCDVDWAAGSFLLFDITVFESLGGFDKKYFMYFEDVDICKRAHNHNYRLTYLPDIKAVHKGAYANRKIFSKHFWWYVKSYLTYHLSTLTTR
ncbi:hypothetical protein ABT56_09760 [Photobacterium aquae]|uniref:dTDP-Rha:alpha-D-GlcNAc-pyrophosphate polyprenol, alpha-3-L-rhamnosyltransferase n=1 Tax=Photobacterium aquae TaxID=1195763 RepID=A0A0J1H1V6_9GAMM|nr:glycosyltransferase family 2 protein [Photobacterium aquae]KLV05819.1 hypothetical protein ABT56_09760 [Photobacterium aquae]